MKLLIVTSLMEFKEDVSNILKKAQIPVFIFSETTGVNCGYMAELTDNWFTSDSDREFCSVSFLSFTDREKAENALEQIVEFNTSDRVEYPVRGFIIPVDKSV
ncbi:MAG TPA: hypothetical protein VFC65_04085 [Prolixibacteraceae bacterium]|nr:hypothetical protein [Prolixibacteraceae bacterium]